MQSVIVVRSADSLRRVGGRTLLSRLWLQLHAAGAEAISVAAPRHLHAAVRAATTDLETPLTVIERAAIGAAGRPLLTVAGNYLLDPRILAHALTRQGSGRLMDGDDVIVEVEGLEAGPVVTWPLSAIPPYSRELRRDLRPYWLAVADDVAERRARRTLAEASGKGRQEWLVILLNRPVEAFLSRYLGETALTPNQLTLFGSLVAVLAAWQFAAGSLTAGVLLALAAQIIDGLDGRQARIQLRFSRWGWLEHPLDKVLEASWILALGWRFSERGAHPESLYAALVWLLAATAANAAGSWFRARRGVLPEEVTRLDAAIRLLAARRNTNVALLGLGVLVGRAEATFWFLVVFAVATAALQWIRTALLLREGSWSR